MNKLVIYTSPTCGPCKALKPVLEEVAATNNIALELVDACKETEKDFYDMGIRAVPTVIAFAHGYEIGRFTGQKTRSEIVKYLANWNLTVAQ
jgi:thioredoxin-like negative regulator of GroEL